jgi:hypothetical protein
MIKSLIVFIVIFSLLLMSIGGLLDLKKIDRIELCFGSISKQHLWSDGIYLLLLAIIILLIPN